MSENVTSITDHGDSEAPEEAQDGGVEAPEHKGEGETALTRSEALRKAYGAATARLREEHREEFERLQVEEAKRLGFDYKPKPTPEQKAEEDLRALLTQFPGLRDKIAPASK